MKFHHPHLAHPTPPHAPTWRDPGPVTTTRFDPVVSQPSSWLASCGHGLADPESGYRFVVAAREIEPGEVVAVFGGTVITAETLASMPQAARSRCLQVEEGLFLYSTVDGPGDWINHSCDPNLELRGQIVLVAARKIEPGEELCFDYATADGSDFDEFSCECGAKNCRGKVTGNDWELQLSAESHRAASPYLLLRQGK